MNDDDDCNRKFYVLLYENKDFQKKLIENKSVIRRRKEYFEFIDEVKAAYNKLPKNRDRRQKYVFDNYAVFSIGDEDKLIKKDQISEVKPLVFTYVENLYDDIKRDHL